MGLDAAMRAEILPILRRIERAIRHHWVRGLASPQLLGMVDKLDQAFMQCEPEEPLRPQLAKVLLYLHHEFERRLTAAPIDAHGLPVLTGVRWSTGSPLAGLADDLPEFAHADLWHAAAGRRRRPRVHHIHRGTAEILPLPGRPDRPPIPPGADIPIPASPIPESSILDTISSILTIIGGGNDIAAVLLDFFGAAAVVAILEIGGLILTILGSFLAMPAVWSTMDKLAEFNGYCRGFWNAMQDMANQFADRRLNDLTEDRWPHIGTPVIHAEDVDTIGQSAEAWRRGAERGCFEAFDQMMTMDSHPRTKSFERDGRRYSVRLTGRLVLRLLYMRHGGGLGAAIRRDIDGRLQRHGSGPWPVYR